ncbi:hypothetical protein M0R45_032288 [Rubus argutus]|uniref:Fungal lipase-type domain-containing protein n=1 Tax=Rubus argutus TaxID=59490 RepID=A0AAW1WIK6_RUBAR
MATKVQDESSYVILRPEGGRLLDLLKFNFLGDVGSGFQFMQGVLQGTDDVGQMMFAFDEAHRMAVVVSIIARKILAWLGTPIKWFGYLLEYILNFISLNGNLWGLLCNLVQGKLVWPQPGTETFLSLFGLVDGRIQLYRRGESSAEAAEQRVDSVNSKETSVASVTSEETSIQAELGNRALMDLCVMASKLAYENANVVRQIVIDHWKMHFVDFYDCWNAYQKQLSTQVFILCDKPKDANFILVSFRGTEPFDADDWATDLDYSWFEIPEMGKIHMGFLEALGLGNRNDVGTFSNQILSLYRPQEKQKVTRESIVMVERSAYYAVRKKLKSLLEEHKNAKFLVTGHSLGGALAILFPCMLAFHEETELMDRLLGVYTFGQPRVGNRQLGRYMESHLNKPIRKYFRVVYSNDLVPRLPYDNKSTLYEHFGTCLYYDSLYNEHITEHEPNRNFLGLTFVMPLYLNAAWELMRSLSMGYTYGPEYQEGWSSILFRMVGLFLPGISAHFITDYVNSVRLGKERVESSF